MTNTDRNNSYLIESFIEVRLDRFDKLIHGILVLTAKENIKRQMKVAEVEIKYTVNYVMHSVSGNFSVHIFIR